MARSAKRRRKCQGRERVGRSRCSRGMDVTPAEVGLGVCRSLRRAFLRASGERSVGGERTERLLLLEVGRRAPPAFACEMSWNRQSQRDTRPDLVRSTAGSGPRRQRLPIYTRTARSRSRSPSPTTTSMRAPSGESPGRARTRLRLCLPGDDADDDPRRNVTYVQARR